MMLRSQFEGRFREIAQPVLCYGTRSAVPNQSYSACLCYAWPWFGQRSHRRRCRSKRIRSEIEKKSFEMIALQQPVSQDLRTVLTVLKAVSDLERMGDYAVSIAKAAEFVWRGSNVSQLLKKKSREWARCQELRWSSLELYLNGSVDQAYEVAAMDEKSTITLIAFVIWLQKKSRKIQMPSLQVVIISKWLLSWNVLETMLKIWRMRVVYFETGKIVEL